MIAIRRATRMVMSEQLKRNLVFQSRPVPFRESLDAATEHGNVVIGHPGELRLPDETPDRDSVSCMSWRKASALPQPCLGLQ
jgi:hypothetical protein